jgi:hypothetical protein
MIAAGEVIDTGFIVGGGASTADLLFTETGVLAAGEPFAGTSSWRSRRFLLMGKKMWPLMMAYSRYS